MHYISAITEEKRAHSGLNIKLVLKDCSYQICSEKGSAVFKYDLSRKDDGSGAQHSPLVYLELVWARALIGHKGPHRSNRS